MIHLGLTMSKPPKQGYKVMDKKSGREFLIDTYNHAEIIATQVIDHEVESYLDEFDLELDQLEDEVIGNGAGAWHKIDEKKGVFIVDD